MLLLIAALFVMCVVYVWRGAHLIPRSHLLVGGLAVILLGFWPVLFLVADVYFARRKASS